MTLTGNSELIDPGFDAPPQNPLIKLGQCLEIADELGISEPRGFVLSTVDTAGRPSSRVVLIKAYDETGIIFGTSQESMKGRDFELNSWAAGTLWWRETVQQISFQGRVTQLPGEMSDIMFQSRTRDAQAVAALS